MTRRRRRTLLILALAGGVTTGGWWVAQRSDDHPSSVVGEAADAVAIVHGTAPAGFSIRRVTPIQDTVTGDAALATRIAASAGLQTSDLRDVQSVDAGRAVCGRVVGTAEAASRRFVWIEAPSLLAIENGGADFARLARVCSGASLRQLAAEAS